MSLQKTRGCLEKVAMRMYSKYGQNKMALPPGELPRTEILDQPKEQSEVLKDILSMQQYLETQIRQNGSLGPTILGHEESPPEIQRAWGTTQITAASPHSSNASDFYNNSDVTRYREWSTVLPGTNLHQSLEDMNIDMQAKMKEVMSLSSIPDYHKES